MKDRVHFFSVEDMSIPHYLQMAEEVIGEYENGRHPDGVNDHLELFHICKFVENKVYPKNWTEARISMIENYHKALAVYFRSLTTETWSLSYSELEFAYKETFFEALDRYSAFACLDEDSIRKAIASNPYELRYILQIKRIVAKLDRTLANLLKENRNTAEWLLIQFVEDEGLNRKKVMFFPDSLTLEEREQIILDYVNSKDPNLNYVRLVLVAKNIPGKLRLSPQTRMIATNRERELNNAYFTGNETNAIPIRYSICLNDDENAQVKWADEDKDGFPVLNYGTKYMLNTADVDLLHYYRYVFDMMTPTGCINLVSKDSDSGVMERVMGMKGRFAYLTNMTFNYNQAISIMQTFAMEGKLKGVGRSIEKAIEIFYGEYLPQKFQYPSLPIKLSSSEDWLEKCRMLLIEMDSVAQQYQLYAENNEINKDLLDYTPPVKCTSLKSVVEKKYYVLNEKEGEIRHLFYLFFSDQCMLTYVEPYKEKHYHCFFDLLKNEKEIQYNNYQDYQKTYIDYLISNDYVSKDKNGYISPVKTIEILLLKQLYQYHACSYWSYETEVRSILDNMAAKGWITIDDFLLTPKERDYYSYYLDNERFTNGLALRNKYIHGTIGHADDAEKHKNSYFRLLSLFMLLLLKIEDDLIIRDKSKEKDTNSASTESQRVVLLSDIAQVMPAEEYQKELEDHTYDGTMSYIWISPQIGANDGYALCDMYDGSSDGFIVMPKNDDVQAEFLAMYLNTIPVRMMLTKKPNLETTAITIEMLNALRVHIPLFEEQNACASLEAFILALIQELDNVINNEKQAVNVRISVLRELRNMIGLELLMEHPFHDNGIYLLQSWTQMLDGLGDVPNDKVSEWAEKKFDDLLMPGNPVMDNLKKAQVLLMNMSSEPSKKN